MKVYPIFLNDLHRRKTVLFGGGPEHEVVRKVEELLDCRTDLTFIGTEIPPEVRELARHDERLTLRERPYEPGDLKGAFLVIVTKTDPEATEPIYREGLREGVALFNAMDDRAHCNYVNGSVHRQGLLTIAISSGGAAPALAVRIKEELAERYGPVYASFLSLMQRLRKPMKATHDDFEERRRRWYALIDAGLPQLMEEGREEELYERISAIAGFDARTSVPDSIFADP